MAEITTPADPWIHFDIGDDVAWDLLPPGEGREALGCAIDAQLKTLPVGGQWTTLLPNGQELTVVRRAERDEPYSCGFQCCGVQLHKYYYAVGPVGPIEPDDGMT